MTILTSSLLNMSSIRYCKPGRNYHVTFVRADNGKEQTTITHRMSADEARKEVTRRKNVLRIISIA